MSGLLANSGITANVLKGTDYNLKDDKCVTSFREHLRNACDKFLGTISNIEGTGDTQKENLAKAKARVARVFDGAEAFEEALRNKFSGFAKEYEKKIRP